VRDSDGDFSAGFHRANAASLGPNRIIEQEAGIRGRRSQSFYIDRDAGDNVLAVN